MTRAVRIIIITIIAALTAVAANGAVDYESVSIDELLSRYGQEPKNKELIKDIAFYYLRQDELRESRKYGEKLLEIWTETGDRDFAQMWGCFFVGASMLDPNPDDAFRNLETSRVIAEDAHNHEALIRIYNMLGIYYLFVNNDAYSALNYYYDAYENAKAIDSKQNFAPILANIAAVYFTMNDPSGLKIAKQAVDYAEKYDSRYVSKPKMILAGMYLISDSTDECERLLRELEGDDSYDVNVNITMAKVYERRGLCREAENLYGQLLEVVASADPSVWSSVAIGYAGLLKKEGRLKEAISILEDGLANARNKNRLVYLHDMLGALAEYYHLDGQPEKAYKVSCELNEYTDSMYALGRERVTRENLIRQEIYTKERLIEAQKRELQSDRLKIWGLVLCLAALGVIVLIVWLNSMKKDKIYHAIVHQNQRFLEREKILTQKLEQARRESQQSAQPQEVVVKDDKTTDSANSERMSELMNRFTSLMLEQNRYADPGISIQSISEELDTNRTYLSKAINEISGKSFTQVINEYRVHRAIELVSDIDTNRPLKQIAFDAGFNSISTFYLTFQKATGMSPAAYRDKMKTVGHGGEID